jgi:hypothetical protein
MVELDSMAGDGGNVGSSLVNRLAKEVQTQLGLLAFSIEQCVMDHLGST